MGMINRWYDILKLLVSHHQVSIKTFKKQLSLSNQTIQKTIIQLNRELQGIALIEEVEDKYQISIVDFDSFNKIMQGSLKKQTDFNSSS
ncbi:HTH domain protein [Eremococcus coleocola ACS-139-V-Col8]|uniref:HTH domain protein n=2 Tax=Eremococcus TaxID=171412 RepID=E4KN51_9LACT|nr:HTH domain protein [Eremococcus coleocola ACS-139-V-Col8]